MSEKNDKKDGWQKADEVGSKMQKIGCLMTLFISIPIVIILLFIMCSR